MITPEKIERINTLARKSKSIGLDAKEMNEQKILREEYLANFRKNFRGQLENIKFVEDETKDVENPPIKS